MTHPTVEYVGVAGQTDFDVTFPFLSPTHVEVLVNGIKHFPLEWVNPTRLRLALAPGAGASVVIQRNTPIEQQLVMFQDGAVLTQEDLNTAVQQLLFKQQELDAMYAGSLQRARIRLADNLGIVTDPEAVAQELAELVLEQQLLNDFRQRINDIDAAGSNIVDLGVTIAAQADAIIAQGAAVLAHGETITAQGEAIIAHGDEIIANTDALVAQAFQTTSLQGLLGQLRTDHESLAGIVDELAGLGDGEGVIALIQQEASARIDGDTALAATLSLIGAKSGTSSAFILDLNNVRVSPTESLATRLTAINATTAGNTAAIQAEQTARTTADQAEAAARTSVVATLRNETAAAVNQEATARATADTAEATARTTLAATLRGETNTKISAAVQVEQTARVAGDAAEATARETVVAVLRDETDDKVGAAVESERTARIAADAAEATARTTVVATLRGETDTKLSAAVQTEQQARATAIAAEATARTTLAATLRGETDSKVSAAIQTEQLARVAGDQAETTARTTLAATLRGETDSKVAAAVQVEQQARATAIAAEATARTTLAATLRGEMDDAIDGVDAAVVAEQAARVAADQAEAQTRTALAATLRGETDTKVAAAIQIEQTARVAGDAAEATARQSLATTLRGETAAAVTAEATARTNADLAFAGNFTLLGAKNAQGTAWVLDDNKVQVSPGVSLGTRLSGIDTLIGTTSASVINEQTARIAADGVLSQSITSVQTNVGGLTSSVSTLSQALNGVKARYGISLDVNGFVTGFLQNNDGSSGSFVVIANRFAIVDPGNGLTAPFVPFEVSGGVTRIKEAIIGSLQVDKLVSGTVWANIGLNGDINVGTGRIIWSNGVYMKVTGVGFGQGSQFISWYGPSMAISACSKANAISYETVDGDAYFGGALTAGILRNSGQTSSLAADASVETGTFGSNGGVIITGASYYGFSSYVKSYPATVQGRNDFDADVATYTAASGDGGITYSGSKSTPGTATVALDRSYNGGAYSQVSTLSVASGTATFDGTRPIVGSDPGEATITASFGGSISYTDPNQNTGNRSYRARMTGRTFSFLTGGVQTQRVTVFTSED